MGRRRDRASRWPARPARVPGRRAAREASPPVPAYRRAAALRRSCGRRRRRGTGPRSTGRDRERTGRAGFLPAPRSRTAHARLSLPHPWRSRLRSSISGPARPRRPPPTAPSSGRHPAPLRRGAGRPRRVRTFRRATPPPAGSARRGPASSATLRPAPRRTRRRDRLRGCASSLGTPASRAVGRRACAAAPAPTARPGWLLLERSSRDPVSAGTAAPPSSFVFPPASTCRPPA